MFNCGNYDSSEKYYNYTSAVKRAAEFNVNAAELEHHAEFVEFDKDNLVDFSNGNYGLIPSDVIIPENIASKITDYTDFYVNIPDGNGGFYDLSWPKNQNDPHYEGRKIISGGTEVKILTYSTLNKWYSFFREYYDLITRPDFARRYSSATEYYEVEFKVKNEDERKRYKELDEIFKSRGGEEMYRWISDNCIIQYMIPEEFVDEWDTTYLYFPDAIKWYQWFKDRFEIYKYVYNIEDCKNTDDCCDCTEYLRLGGNDFYAGKDRKGGLKAWVENVILDTSYATLSASFTVPVNIMTSIDDLGEMSILSSEWQAEVDYHNTLEEKGYSLASDGKGGTIVSNLYTIDDYGNKIYFSETFMIKNGSDRKGYNYNEYYDNVANYDLPIETRNDWIPYTDYYIEKYKEQFASNGYKNGELVAITGYTISPINGKIVYNPVDEDIVRTVKLNIIDSTCINGITYEVINGKYVQLCYDTNSLANLKYKKHEKLQIFKDGDLEYAVLNGKRKYVEVNSKGEERVYFLRESDCYDEGCKVEKGEYIIFDSILYLVDAGFLTIEEDDAKKVYPILDGYFNIDENRFYISGESIVIQDEYVYDEENGIYTFKFRKLTDEEFRVLNIKRFVINGNNVKLYYNYEVNTCTVISGYTDSKLDLLRRKEITTDDLGNELPGYFRSIVDENKGSNQSRYNVPYDQCTLDILYKVGEVSDLYPNENLSSGTERYFDGNIITGIKFYYADEFRNPKIVVEANNDNALNAIAVCEQMYKDSDDESIVNVMFCEITYYIGAVISAKGEDGKTKYSLAEQFHKGVKYVDTVYVSKEVGTYYMNDDSTFTFNYYLLTQDVELLHVTDYNALLNWDISTYFEMKPTIYVMNGNEISMVGSNTEYSGWSENNNVVAAPLFRTEFNLASSFPQNVDADIYIDRGISAAFEKHLKLQEIRTMEALENLGNTSSISGFKINEY